MIDPIVAEVRRIRDAHAKKFNYDLGAICADIRQHQEQCGHRIIRRRRVNAGVVQSATARR